MLIAGILIAVAALSQTPGKAEATTWVITLADGDVTHVIATEDQFNLTSMKVPVDEPWRRLAGEDVFITIRPSEIKGERYREPSSARRDRIRKGWEANGGVEVETPNGPGWVLKDEYELSQEARHRAGVDSLAPGDDPVENGADVLGPVSTVDPPGFLAQWGAHLGIAFAAVGLSILVVWTLIIR